MPATLTQPESQPPRTPRAKRRDSLPTHAWNPADYAAHAAAQRAWASDLFSRLELRGTERLLDVGCGDGSISADLARALPEGEVLGIDNSADMITHARAAWGQSVPNLHFEVMDAREIRLESPVDVVFSNAALHWVDDHPAFLRGAAQALRPGGRLLVSCGGKGNAADVFQALRPVMRDPRWRAGFKGMHQPYHFHTPAQYTAWLQEAGLRPTTVRLQPRTMTQPNPGAFAGWIRTTWLPYTSRVAPPWREPFIDSIVRRYLESHPADTDGTIRVRMVRLEIDATKA